MKRVLGSIPGVIVSLTILALGLSVFMYARVHTPKPNDVSNRTVREPLETTRLKDLRLKAMQLQQVQPGKRTEPSISTSFVGVGVDVYRSIVLAQKGQTLEEATALQRARIFDNDVHRRFLRLESLSERTIAAADWVRDMKKAVPADAPHFSAKQWANFVKSGKIKGSTWAVICLWIRSEIDRGVPNLRLEVDRMALRNRWFPYDMTDLEGIKDVVGVEPPTKSLVSLGTLAGQTSILFPLYIEELLEVPSKERRDEDSKSYSNVGEVVYFPRMLAWDEPDTGTTKTNSSLLTQPLYVSPPDTAKK